MDNEWRDAVAVSGDGYLSLGNRVAAGWHLNARGETADSTVGDSSVAREIVAARARRAWVLSLKCEQAH